MNTGQVDIYPISQARSLFSRLIDTISQSKTVLLTKKGRVKAALVDFSYLKKLEEDLKALYQKTFIDKKLIPYTRIFSDKEIEEWKKEDAL